MIFASSRLLIKRQLGDNRFSEEWSISDKSELTSKGYSEWKQQQQKDEKPYTLAERELHYVKNEQSKVQQLDAALKLTHLHGVTCQIGDQDLNLIKDLSSSLEYNLMILVCFFYDLSMSFIISSLLDC
jgi:hypothetical protein